MHEKQVIHILKALADENRLRATLALTHQELCVCQIVELLGLAPSTVSKHLTILKDAGIIKARKNGKWVFYRLADNNPRGWQHQILKAVITSTAKDEQARQDAKRLQKILAQESDILCR